MTTTELGDHAYRHDLIQGEFREALTSSEHPVNPNTDAVVVLSEYEFVMLDGQVDTLNAQNDENIARLEVGIDLAKEVAAKRANKPVEDVDNTDILLYAPALVLNGTTEQLPVMGLLVSQMGFPKDRVATVDCGPAGVGNTKTQIEATRAYAAEYGSRHVALVSSAYHVPRIKRAGNVGLDDVVSFDVVHVPHSRVPIEVSRFVRGEVGRIIRYAAKGDISKDA